MSYEDFRAQGETKYHEYYEGLCVVNPPTVRHGIAVAQLIAALSAATEADGRVVVTETGWEAGHQQLFVPDLMIVDPAVAEDPVVSTPSPLLVVEITSPSTRSDDWGTKLVSYAANGASWYWIVDLEVPEVTVFENTGAAFAERLRTGELCDPPPYRVPIDPGRLGRPAGPAHAGTR